MFLDWYDSIVDLAVVRQGERDADSGEFAYWFHLDEPHPRGQWNNAIMNAFVAPPRTWSSRIVT